MDITMDNLILCVNIKNEDFERLKQGGTYCSKDERLTKGKIMKTCGKNSIQYSEVFVSVGCFCNDIPKISSLRNYGDTIVQLKDSVVEEIRFVVGDDFLDFIEGLYKREIKSRPKCEYLKKYKEINGDFQQKRESIIKISKEANKLKYAEARIFRELTINDVLSLIK